MASRQPGPCPCGMGYDNDGDGNCPRCVRLKDVADTTRINLATAKLAHQKMVEQLSMRTATVAQMAAVLISAKGWPEKWGAAAAVKVAEELMAEAEASAAKAKELEAALTGK